MISTSNKKTAFVEFFLFSAFIWNSGCINRSTVQEEKVTQKDMIGLGTFTTGALLEFELTTTPWGWKGKFPGPPRDLFGKEISVDISTSNYRIEPEDLPPISEVQAALVQKIALSLPAILLQVEEAMTTYNKPNTDFQRSVSNPHVWLKDERNDESWAFVVETTDSSYCYHIEFKGTKFLEIWAGS